MPITGSTFTLEGAQLDGSRWCREVHTVTGGATVERYYLTPVDFDASAAMTARVPTINAEIAEDEAAANMDRDGALTVLHQTGAQFAARLRAAVREGTRERACYIAWWLLRRIAAGHVTDAQCQAAFGLTAAQWTTFKTNSMIPRSNAHAAMLAAGGV